MLTANNTLIAKITQQIYMMNLRPTVKQTLFEAFCDFCWFIACTKSFNVRK